MKRAIASIVLLLFTLYVQSVPAYWAVYFLFADRIAVTYCMNPGNPECHGRCHVVATTAKQERQDAPASEIRLDKLPLFIAELPVRRTLAACEPRYHEAPDDNPAAGFRSPIDHPPLVSI
jgi:hypothetical protein